MAYNPLTLVFQGIVAFRAVEYEPLTLFNDTYKFPGWAEGLGWSYFLFLIIIVF